MSKHAKNPWLVLVLICLAQFMVILDATIVNVALPSIQKDLGLSEANLQWIVNAYTLVFGGFLLLGGRAGDLLGRKRVFLVGLVIFTTASLLNGLATSSGMLIGFRALQGLGAALISPAALSIISTTFEEGKERAKALGVWAAIAIGGSAVGLVLGGALTQSFSWPWIFFVNVPVGIVAFFLALRFVPESKDEHAHKSYDVGGAITVTGGLMMLVYAIVKAETDGWTSGTTLGYFVAAFALLAAFLVIEMRVAEPLVRLSIFRIALALGGEPDDVPRRRRACSRCSSSTRCTSSACCATGRSRPASLPAVHGRDHGLGGLASNFAPRIGVRPVAAVGMVADRARHAPVRAHAGRRSYASDVLPAMILASLGMGAVFMPLTLVATTGLEDEDQGLASGLFNTSQQVGGALGLAILSTIAAGQTHGRQRRRSSCTASTTRSSEPRASSLAGLVVMVAMLRKRHVAKIETVQSAEALVVNV